MIRAFFLPLLLSASVFAAPPGTSRPVQSEAPIRDGQLKWLPVNVSFVPPLSVNSFWQFHTVNAFSLDVLVGYSDALAGLELSGIGSINGDTRGAAIGGIFNWSSGAMDGIQVGGVVNFAGGDARGAQIGGAVNVADGITGLQLAPVNVARNASTAQIGVVNVADEADVSIGVLSWIRKGTRNVVAAATEYGSVLEADTGGRLVYGILAAGPAFRFRAQPQRYLLGGGIGWRAITSERFSLDVQAVSFQVVDSDAWSHRGLHSVRAISSLRVAGPLSVFVGPTFNVLVDGEARKIDLAGYGWSAGSDVRMWPGFFAGVRLF